MSEEAARLRQAIEDHRAYLLHAQRRWPDLGGPVVQITSGDKELWASAGLEQLGYEPPPRLPQSLLVAAEALLDAPHVVQIGAEGGGLEHTLLCRSELGGLPECPYTGPFLDWLDSLDGPPAEVGTRWIVELTEDDPGLVLDAPAPPDPALALREAVLAARERRPS